MRAPRAFVRLVRLPGLPFVRRFARVRRGLVAQRVDLGAGRRRSSVVGARGLGLGAAFSSQLGKPGFPRRLIVAGVLHVGGCNLVRGWAESAFLGGLAGACLRPLKGGLSVFPERSVQPFGPFLGAVLGDGLTRFLPLHLAQAPVGQRGSRVVRGRVDGGLRVAGFVYAPLGRGTLAVVRLFPRGGTRQGAMVGGVRRCRLRYVLGLSVVGARGTGRAWSSCDLARLVIRPHVVPRRLGGRRRGVVSPEHIRAVEHGERLTADARLAVVGVRWRWWGGADLRAARSRVFLGQLAMFFLGGLLPFSDGAQQVIGDLLCVRRRFVHLLRVVVDGFDPALHVRRATAAVVSDADTFTRHHRGHFGPEFFAGVLGAAEVPDAVFEGVAVIRSGWPVAWPSSCKAVW